MSWYLTDVTGFRGLVGAGALTLLGVAVGVVGWLFADSSLSVIHERRRDIIEQIAGLERTDRQKSSTAMAALVRERDDSLQQAIAMSQRRMVFRAVIIGSLLLPGLLWIHLRYYGIWRKESSERRRDPRNDRERS